jgi:UDP-N-acetylglucosamine 2-epimerase (non-hydrolysing)
MPQEMTTPSVDIIVAARPNFMKVAPLWHALARAKICQTKLIHTGQHYDFSMSDAFIRDLDLPSPDIHLNIRSGSHAEQTGQTMIAYEASIRERRPDMVIVVGDVNATLACTIAAKKLSLTVAHLEAGLRSGDRTMPEEINRIATDSIADIHWTPSQDGTDNLLSEGHRPDNIVLVGNVMIDSFEMLRGKILSAGAPERHGLVRGKYGVATLHRPANVDDRSSLTRIVDSLLDIAKRIPLIFPVHPRTRSRLRDFGLDQRLGSAIKLIDPVGYIDFMSIVTSAAFVLTDSGGVQEESTYLNIPCLTLRDNTERPITVTLGSNRLVTLETLIDQVDKVLAGRWQQAQNIPNWDGNTASRIVADIHRHLIGRA